MDRLVLDLISQSMLIFFNVDCAVNIVLIVFFEISSRNDHNCFMSYGEIDRLSV